MIVVWSGLGGAYLVLAFMQGQRRNWWWCIADVVIACILFYVAATPTP